MSHEVLHVCANNVGRSQWAAAYWNQHRPGEADSAGTIVEDDGGLVKDWVGGADKIIQVAEEDGLDIANEQRTLLTEEMVGRYGLVIVWAQVETRPAWLKKEPHIFFKDIIDPVHMTLEAVRHVRDQVKDETLGVLEWYRPS